MVNSKNLLQILQPTLDVLRAFDWKNKASYANWSAQTFYIVNHTTRLFSLAAAKTPMERNDFHNRFLKHMAEEKGHENLASTDLKALGFKLSDFPELPSTAALYRSQYYWIHQVSAYSFFGYLIALEGLAATAGKEVRQILSEAHVANSTKFIKVHSEEDLGHIEEVFEWLAKMPEAEQEHVYKNLVTSLNYYSGMLLEITAASAKAKKAS